MRNWSNLGGRRRVRNVWWLIFYCLPAQILKVIVGLWRRQSLIPSEQIVPVWGKNGGYVKNYQLSWEGLIHFREDILPNKAVQIREKYAKIIMSKRKHVFYTHTSSILWLSYIDRGVKMWNVFIKFVKCIWANRKMYLSR